MFGASFPSPWVAVRMLLCRVLQYVGSIYDAFFHRDKTEIVWDLCGLINWFIKGVFDRLFMSSLGDINKNLQICRACSDCISHHSGL